MLSVINNSLLVQFGRTANISGTDTTKTQTLPIGYKNHISMVLLTNANCGYHASIYEAGLTLTSIKIRREASAGIGSWPVYWFTIGY